MEPKGGRDGDRRRDLAEGSTIISESAFCFTKLQRYQFFFEMASRGIAASCRKVVCIGRNYAYALSPYPLLSPKPAPRRLRQKRG